MHRCLDAISTVLHAVLAFRSGERELIAEMYSGVIPDRFRAFMTYLHEMCAEVLKRDFRRFACLSAVAKSKT